MENIKTQQTGGNGRHAHGRLQDCSAIRQLIMSLRQPPWAAGNKEFLERLLDRSELTYSSLTALLLEVLSEI